MVATRVQRRLAAVLAADVAGYSRLVERDEPATLARLKALRRELLEPFWASHRGRVVKLMGDGAIIEFASVVDAMQAALAMQAEVARREAAEPDDRRLVFRIGVHVGDVVVEADGDLLGDGVNIAARLEQVGTPGGIVLSGAAHDQLHGKLACVFEDLGELRLKNIERPVRAWRVGAGPAPKPQPNAGADLPSVAVLPFDNMSDDPSQSWFSDGITEDVITELSRFREVLVIARNSSFTFRGRAVDVREIGRALGVTHVVEGSVRRAGERVRISAQLVDAATGAHLWAERYDRPLQDVFAVQEEMASGIASAVALRMIEDRAATARRRPPQDARAYDLLLQARAISDTFTPDAQARARQLYEEAIRLDPGLARAWTGLAYNHFLRGQDEGLGRPLADNVDHAEALRCAERAVALDPNDPRVHLTLAFMCMQHRAFDRVGRHVALARALNPNDPAILAIGGWAFACLGEAARGLDDIARAKRLNPRHPEWYERDEARSWLLARRPAEAAALMMPAVSARPLENPRDLAWLVAALGQLDRRDEARRWAALLLRALVERWRGDPAADDGARLGWLIDSYPIARAEDVAHLRDGLRRAGLPVAR